MESEVKMAVCGCCGLAEECTPAYIAGVQERFQGRWVCGLCAEAVSDEIGRAGSRIGTEEAVTRHMSFCSSFRASSPDNSAGHLISAVRQVLRRGLDSPRGTSRSTPTSPVREAGGVSSSALARSGSYLSTMAR